MKEKFLKFIFKRYRTEIEDLLVEEYYGFIPSSLNDPAIDFLAGARTTLERFFSIQAYNVQKRALQDSKNSERYTGMLIHIRSLLAAIQKGRIERKEVEIKPQEENLNDKVEDFIKSAKQFLS